MAFQCTSRGSGRVVEPQPVGGAHGSGSGDHLETLADALIAGAPPVVVLDDLHCADAIAIRVLEPLPRALGDASVALVATSRDHEPDMPELDALRQVARLIRLDVEAVHRAASNTPANWTDSSSRPIRSRVGGASATHRHQSSPSAAHHGTLSCRPVTVACLLIGG